jgi:hypothetical protein
MSVEEIEKAITKLSPEERAKFRAWWQTFDGDEWDRQIESDLKAGRFDAMADEAVAEHKAGRSRKL